MPRPRAYRAEALVLRRSDFGEADRLLTLFTREQGKVRALAKGARRPTSRHSGNLELFVQVQLLLARGRDLDVVTQSQLLHPFRRVREDLVSASHAYYFAEVADAFVEPGDPSPIAFELLLEALTALEEGRGPTLLAAHFLLRLLDVLGFRPELFRCLDCGAELRPERNLLSALEGGGLCPRCGPRHPEAHPIGVDVFKLLRYLQRTERLGSLEVGLPPGLAEQADGEVRRLVEYHLDRKLRSPAFIVRLRELGDRLAASLPNSARDGR